MESLEGVDRLMMSGTRGTLVLAPGAKLDEADVRQALADQGLEFGSLATQQVRRPGAAFVASTPGFT